MYRTLEIFTFEGVGMRYFLFLMIWGIASGAFAAPDSSLFKLNQTLARKQVFEKQKQDRLQQYYQQLKGVKDKQGRFRLLQALSDEYKSYISDSAYRNIQKMQQVANELNDPVKISYAKLKLSFVLLSAGMFKETLDSLGTLTVHGLPDSIRLDYYSILARTYYDMGDFMRDGIYTPQYIQLANRYVDSAHQVSSPKSYQFLYLSGLRNLKNENTAEALATLTQLMNEYDLTPHQLAVTASTLSYYYISRKDFDFAIALLARAAIADLQTATKETAAMSSLAELLYQRGDLANAYTYIQQAMDDAVYYGARQRKVQVGSILPVIAAAQLSHVEGQRRVWITYSSLVTVLVILIAAFAWIISKQLKKRKIAERALQEANKIKEEYIGYYFNGNSEYLARIEAFKKSIEMKLLTKKYDDIRLAVNNINMKREREDLYNSFDKVFLKLFPDFVTTFNSYFTEEDRIVLKEGQLLNTELRIFALIRMGIHDNEKIARILDYSINTIYNYKARVKSKSLIPNEEFEKKIMEIHAL